MHKTRRNVRQPSGIWWPEAVVVTIILAAFLLVDAIGVPAPPVPDQVGVHRDRGDRPGRERGPR